MFDENFLPFIAGISPTIMWIAVTVGLLLFVIGYFAGAKLAMGRIGMCILLVTIVGSLALPAPMKLFSVVLHGMNLRTTVVDTGEEAASKKAKTSTKDNADKTSTSTPADPSNNDSGGKVPFSLQLLSFLLYLIWTSFLVAMGIFLYETLTVTAEEAEKR